MCKPARLRPLYAGSLRTDTHKRNLNNSQKRKKKSTTHLGLGKLLREHFSPPSLDVIDTTKLWKMWRYWYLILPLPFLLSPFLSPTFSLTPSPSSHSSIMYPSLTRCPVKIILIKLGIKPVYIALRWLTYIPDQLPHRLFGGIWNGPLNWLFT